MASIRRNSSVQSVADVDTAEMITMNEANSRNIPFGSVIKVFVVTAKPNYLLPWQMARSEACTGSAFYIGDKLILTNAHVVRDFTTVRVRRHGGTDKTAAKVLCINDSCDLALITVEDDKFWDGMAVLKISNLIPELYENTMVIGYPMGGDNICATRGVVSRVTTLAYEDSKFFLSNPELIAVQLDAAINSGNSGGPALDEVGHVVGVAFCGYAGSADNIGYIIPFPVIDNFLSRFKTGAFGEGLLLTRVCDFGFNFMLCENPSLRAKHKILGDLTGVLVTKVSPLGAAAIGGLKELDVLCEIKGRKIKNDGTIDFRRDERLSFLHLVGTHTPGEKCGIKVMRDGKAMNLKVPGMSSPELVNRHRAPGSVPSYYIVGGVVFTPLTCGLLDVAVEVISEEAWQSGRGAIKEQGQQIVVCISILAHPINHGYDIHRLPMLCEFNGEKILNIEHLKKLVDTNETDFHNFKLGEGTTITLNKAQCATTEAEILKTYCVPAPCSEDLLDYGSAVKRADSSTKPKRKASASGGTKAAAANKAIKVESKTKVGTKSGRKVPKK